MANGKGRLIHAGIIVYINWKMEMYMKVIGRMIKLMGLVYIIMLMEQNM